MAVVRSQRTGLLGILAGAIGVTALLLVLEVLLRLLPVSSGMSIEPVHAQAPILHYSPSQSFTFSRGWQFALVNRGHVNNYGFVNDQDYVRHSQDGPVVVIGDSYVEALMVPYRETVQGRLSTMPALHRPVYSVGVSGSQLSQYVAFAEFAWREFHPALMVFIIVGNDFDESLRKYRDDPGYHYFVDQPVLTDSLLTRVDYTPSRIKRLARTSTLVRYLWETGGAAQLPTRVAHWMGDGEDYVGNTRAAVSDARLVDSRLAVESFLAELARRVPLDRTKLLFVVDAVRPAIYSEQDLQAADTSYFALMRRYFLDTVSRAGHEVLDLQPRMVARARREGLRFEWPIDGHWNAFGHEEAARAIADSETFRAVARRDS